MISAKDRLDKFGGIGPGFDAWRLSLSIMVMFLHTFFVCYGRYSEISSALGYYGRPVFVATLPIFFGLSGFLVAASAERTSSVFRFLWLRVLRLVPALAVETTLAALILGPLLTTLPLSEYFTHKTFFAYFGNIVGRVRYALPGVFEDSLEPGIVNLNLWTLHAELECYAIMAAAIIAGLIRRRNLALALWLAATACLAAWNVITGEFETGSVYPTSIFTYSFCTCVVAYAWRDRVPLDRRMFIGAILLYCAIVYLPQTVFLVVPLLAYIMIYVGLSPRLAMKVPGDYSYGIYLYSFVITQAVASFVPNAQHWWAVFPAALVPTIGVAALSWHYIEKPCLRFKKALPIGRPNHRS